MERKNSSSGAKSSGAEPSVSDYSIFLRSWEKAVKKFEKGLAKRKMKRRACELIIREQVDKYTHILCRKVDGADQLSFGHGSVVFNRTVSIVECDTDKELTTKKLRAHLGAPASGKEVSRIYSLNDPVNLALFLKNLEKVNTPDYREFILMIF